MSKQEVYDISCFAINLYRMVTERLPDNIHLGVVCAAFSDIAKRLHHLAEVFCNQRFTERQENAYANLQNKAKDLAKQIGVNVYVQGDPRGASLWILPYGMDIVDMHQNYTKGLCVPY